MTIVNRIRMNNKQLKKLNNLKLFDEELIENPTFEIEKKLNE